jgi:hypothetical protein
VRWETAWPRAARDTAESCASGAENGPRQRIYCRAMARPQRRRTGDEPRRTKQKTGGVCVESKNRIKNRRRGELSERETGPRTAHLRANDVGNTKSSGDAETSASKERTLATKTQAAQAVAHDSEEEKKTQNPSATPRKRKPRLDQLGRC